MIQFLFFIIIAAVTAAVLNYKLKSVPVSKKIAIGGGGLAAAAIALVVQAAFTWYMGLLVIVAVSLAASFLYMKVLEKEQAEHLRLAEERKERRQALITPQANAQPSLNKIQSAPEAKKVSALQEQVEVKIEDEIDEDQTEREAVPTGFGMQSIQPVGKGHSREQ